MERREKDVAGGRARMKRKKGRVLLIIGTSSDSGGGSQMAKNPINFVKVISARVTINPVACLAV